MNQFYRRLKLKSHFKDKTSTATKEDILFRKKSNWTPTKNHHTVETFISLVNNDLMGMKPKSKLPENLTNKEKQALDTLRNRTDIVITKADKGGAVVIMDTESYIAEAERQLNDTKYYKTLPHDVTDLHEEKVKQSLKTLTRTCDLKENIAEGLAPTSSKTPKFYLLPKIHKKQRPPPGRPVINSINSPTSNISKYVDHQLHPIVTKLPSYVKDTTDFVKKLDTVKTAPDNCYLVTMDVKSLYTNIPHAEGIDAVKTFMNQHRAPAKAVSIVTTLLHLILTLNNFIFNSVHYLQQMGCPMGTKCAPNYANLFMGDFENKFIYPLIRTYSVLYLRYIDDIFMLWKGSKEQLDNFINAINEKHPTIKFDFEISQQQVNFLDTTVYIEENNIIKTKLYTKETDTHNYLHRKSVHPEKLKRTIPYGQALRVRRICTMEQDFDASCIEMTHAFMKRGYPQKEVTTQIRKAKDVPRDTALTSKEKAKLTRIPLVLTYNPTLPPVMDSIKKHWHILQTDPALRETFKDLPMTAYRRNKNIGDILNSNTLVNNQVKRKSSGKSQGKCRPCHTNNRNMCCNHMKSCNSFKSAITNKVYRIFHDVTCRTKMVVYLLECKLCPKVQYVGKSESPANIRINKHRDDCKISTSIDIDQHFRLPGHDFNQHAVFTIIEKMNVTNKSKKELREILERREDFWVMELKTLKPLGLNAKLNHPHEYTGILHKT